VSELHTKLAQSGDHHHSHGIIHMMIEGALIGGVTALLAHLVSNGLSHVVDKWQEGEHHAIDADQLKSILGADKLSAIAEKTGLSVDDAAKYLSQHLPGAAKKHFGG
jgi:uncharacterized protein YidB (DUF937 family)